MNPWTHVVGWTLIHFVWQGAVLAVIAAAVLRLCRHRSANARYASACVVLAGMLASPVITARVLLVSGPSPAPVVALPQAIEPGGTVSTAPRSWIDNGTLSIASAWADIDTLLPAIVFAWIAGVVVLMLRMAGGLWHVRRLQVRSLGANPSRWQTAAERMASRLGVRVAVHVVESTLVDVPSAVGWLRPVILLPIAALGNLTPSQVEAILAHELIHIRRHDYLVNVAQAVAETFLFFHPGVWWVSRQIRLEREHCCDDVAVQVCGDPLHYATALAELEAWRSRGTTLALAAVNGSLTGRVRRILRVPIAQEARSAGWVVTLGLTLVVVVLISGIYVASFGIGAAAPAQTADNAQVEPIASPGSFGWQVRRTDHFDIYYYPALAPNLEQVAVSAERAYQRISTELQYNLPFKVPLVLFKTRSDFAQQTIISDVGGAGAIARGEVTGFAEPKRNRVVLLAEEEPDRLYRQITHELTHIFAFDIIPRSRSNERRVPVWIDEGLAEYMTDVWEPADLTQVHDLVAANNVPKMTAFTGSDWRSTVPPHHLGHVVFEFIEAEYGKPAVWQFLLEVRRNVVDGAGNPYQAAFNRTPEEFDTAFAQYLRMRLNR